MISKKLKFKKKRITVMGIGLHGGAIDLIKWLLKQGASVTATDIKTKGELDSSLEKLKGLKNLTINAGQHRSEDFEKADMIIKNPAVPWNNKYIQMALKKEIPVETDSGLFFQLCSTKKIIGVTGTKGKTTTSFLIAEMIKQAGRKVVEVGIGQGKVMSKLKEINSDTWVVMELSSWRLSALKKNEISPHIAVITNIYPDHLNYYGNMESYIADKKNIFAYQNEEDMTVINWDNEETREMRSETKGKNIFYAMEEINDEVERKVYIKEGKIRFNFNGEEGEVCDMKDIRLRGPHNVSNILAMTGVGLSIGIKPESIKKTASNFKSIHHRLEFLANIDGVKFYNDTAATMPESAVAAINSFMAPINLICGGSSKKLDLTKLGNKIAKDRHVKKVFLLKGTATEALEKTIKEAGGEEKIVGAYEDLESAVNNAKAQSREKEIILLSPGCASFGMFKNEFDRGDKFKKIVEGMK
jgi:UDP-N-acetylmuramoylalanine--D-glutamate ligase